MDKFVDRWRSGDPPTHCTHCEDCGLLFRTQEVKAHLVQAHLGGKAEHSAHREAGCAMLVSLAAGIVPEGLEEWVATELRLRDVREALMAPRLFRP